MLDAAATELAEAGAGGVSVAAVATRAGVHETSIYRRWGTKEALLLEAALELTAAAVPEPDTGSLRGDLIAMVDAMDSFLGTALGAALVRVARADAASGGGSPRQAFWDERLGAQGLLVERAQLRGELREDVDLDLLMRMLIGALHTRVVFGGDPFTGRRAEELVDLVLQGAAPADQRRWLQPTPAGRPLTGARALAVGPGQDHDRGDLQ